MLYDAIMSGLLSVYDYLSLHVLTCLVPAFFIAGAIAVFISKQSVIKYFSSKSCPGDHHVNPHRADHGVSIQGS